MSSMEPVNGKVKSSRASLACQSCRRSKSRCTPSESSSKCTKCFNSSLECIFDASLSNSRPKGVDQITDSRISALESKVSVIEQGIDSRVRENSDGLDEASIKMRLLNLENQIVNLLAVSNNNNNDNLTNNSPPLPHFPPPFSHHNPHNSVHGPIHQQNTLGPPVEYGFNYQDGREKGEYLELKSEVSDGKKRRLDDDVENGDFIDRGRVSFSEAQLCFDSYFLHLPNQSFSSSSRKVTLPFLETRKASPLLFSTLVSIGARSLSHCETFQIASNEALKRVRNLSAVRNTQFTTPFTSLDLKAMILLTLYHGMHELASLVADVTLRLKLNQSLLNLDRNPHQTNFMVSQAIRNGRTFLISWITSTIYSYNAGPFFSIPGEVLVFQLDILESSAYSQQPTDRIIRIHVEECLIIQKVWKAISPSERIYLATYEEIVANCESGLKELSLWNNRFQVMMELVSQWGDDKDLKTAIPLHHGILTLCSFPLRYLLENNRLDQRDPQLESFCHKSGKSALGMLQFGVESRIWLPFSSVANFLHYVNIPLAVELLSIVAHLYPQSVNFSAIRPIFQRLSAQLSLQVIPSDQSTRAERERAIKTKEMVLAFERYWFDFEGVDGIVVVREENRDDVDEIKGSLNAFTAELQLWGSILLDALDDVE